MIDEKNTIIVKLLPDPVINEVSESRNAGLVKLSIKLNKSTDPKEKIDHKQADTSPNNNIDNIKSYYVVAIVYQVYYLLNSESLSDSRRQ